MLQPAYRKQERHLNHQYCSRAIAATLGLLLSGCDVANYITDGPAVSTGIGAKLLCSAEYVIGNDREQAFADVSQYSPILGQLEVTYNEEARSVTASFLGLDEKTASYIPGLGCAIDFNGHAVRQTINTRDLPANDAAWPAGDLVDTIDPSLQAQLDDIVAQDNREGLNTRALLVVHDGRIVAERYAQMTTERTRLLGWSMAKSLTAIMLGNLEMRGLIDLTAAPDFDGWSSGPRADIRIDHLLTMTDGLDFSEQYAPGDDATAMLFTAPSAADYAMAKPLAHEPGTQFNYSSGTANLLARLYTDTVGSPQAAYDALLDHVLIPMGFQHATLEMDASGAFVGSSYLYASARDWARMGQMMLNGGTLNGQRVVAAEWVTRAITPNNSGNEKAYGYQWWLNDGDDTLRFPTLPADAYFASGNREQTVMVIPSENTVIVRLGWTSGNYPEGLRFRRILDAL